MSGLSLRLNFLTDQDTERYHHSTNGRWKARKKIKGLKTKQRTFHVEQSASKISDILGEQLPHSAYEIKFRDCASNSIKPLPEKQLDEIIARIKHLEDVDDISEVIELLG